MSCGLGGAWWIGAEAFLGDRQPNWEVDRSKNTPDPATQLQLQSAWYRRMLPGFLLLMLIR